MHSYVAWLVFGVATVAVAVVLLVVRNRSRFERRLGDEMRALFAASPRVDAFAAIDVLPPPVARYHDVAVGDRAPVRTLRLRHGGTFCMSANGKSLPIRGRQVFTADPPGFVWAGRIRMAPGLWVDARDMCIEGRGTMRVLVDDTLKLADASGPELDQGAALRLLAEMPWFPTALFDARTVSWAAIDDHSARATLRIDGLEVSGVFEFGADGLPLRMTAERFTDKGELRPWGGTYRSFRTVSGMCVPFEAEVTWQLDTGPLTYARWVIESMVFDEPETATLPSSTKRALTSPVAAKA